MQVKAQAQSTQKEGGRTHLVGARSSGRADDDDAARVVDVDSEAEQIAAPLVRSLQLRLLLPVARPLRAVARAPRSSARARA